jgi:hypothetical protein
MAMPTPIREQILSAISTAVDGEYDLPLPVDEQELPWCSVKEGEETASDDEYGNTTIEMEVVVGRGALAANSDREELRKQGSYLLAGVIADMYADETFTGLVERTSYSGGFAQAELGKMCLVAATFSVRYTTVRGDPYNIA